MTPYPPPLPLHTVLAICGPMIYKYDLYAMLLMQANPLRGKVRGGWTLEIETFLGPVKWPHAVRRVAFGAQNSCEFQPIVSFFCK
jgi:hypothetical protein